MGYEKKSYRKFTKSYLASSSIRGIPRVIKAKTPISRLTWSVVLTVLTAVGTFQLSEILSEYLKHETTQDVRQARNLTSTFPSITLCNLQPLNSDANSGINAMDRYVKMIKKIEDGFGIEFFKSLYSITAFFQNSKRAEVEQVSHLINHFIRGCTIQYYNEGELKSVKCDMIDSSRFPHPDYFNCYTFHPKVRNIHESRTEHNHNRSHEVFIRSVKMILYLDDFAFPILPENFDDSSAVRHGVRLVIHPHRSYPDLENKGIEIPPGVSATFRLATTYHNYLSKPYGNCRPGIPDDIVASDPAADKTKLLNYLYTRDVCRKICLQHRIIRKCSCLDPSLPIPQGIIVFEDSYRNTLGMIRRRKRSSETEPDLDHVKSETIPHFPSDNKKYVSSTNESVLLPYCLKWVYTEDPYECVESFLNRQRCWQETKEQLNRITSCTALSCDHTCSSVHYDYQITKSRWPHEAYHLGLYKNYIKNQSSIAKHFTLYEDIIRVAQKNMSHAYDMLMSSRLIERNFVELQFVRPDDKVTNIKDIQQFTASRLLSSIGGALNLWTGVTVIALVEAMELICTLIWMLFQSKKKPLSDNEKTNLLSDTKSVDKTLTLESNNVHKS